MKERGKSIRSFAGHLLLASPSMTDPNFRRTVILMSAHDGEGAMGAVLNRPAGRTLGVLNPEFASTTLGQLAVFRGGPVEADKLILAAWQTRDDLGEFQLNFGLEPNRAIELMGTQGVTVRAFLGYAGWGKGQLENEMRHQTWYTAPVTDYNLASESGTGLWRLILGSLGPDLKLLAEEPDDPAMN
ncbi:MAG TPA: YqgE/AlgH family protein [Candidatus Didemnitutus sp.]|nr:YqgE/AlgH family protein [Candidatus Didemnitutus sp.]